MYQCMNIWRPPSPAVHVQLGLCLTIYVYADLPGMFARLSVSPQATIPSSFIVAPYHPDTAIHNETSNMVASALLEFFY